VLIEQAQQNVQLQEEGLRIADSHFRNGATSELDVTQAATLLESTRASVPQLQVGAQQARNALSTLLGRPSGTFDALLAGRKDIPNTPAKVAVSVPAEMLRRRPDIRSAEFNAAAQCARIGVAKAELYPSFSLVGTIGLTAGTGGVATSNLFSTDSLFYAVGPRINWPFFNYGRLKNGVRVQDARFQQLLVNYRDTVLKAAQEVEDALAGFLNARDAVVFQERAVAAARRSVSSCPQESKATSRMDVAGSTAGDAGGGFGSVEVVQPARPVARTRITQSNVRRVMGLRRPLAGDGSRSVRRGHRGRSLDQPGQHHHAAGGGHERLGA